MISMKSLVHLLNYLMEQLMFLLDRQDVKILQLMMLLLLVRMLFIM